MLNHEITIAGRSIGGQTSPYVIAEVGSNFNQNRDTARQLIDVAADAGAQAVKFQLFRADVLYPNRDGLYDVFKAIELNPDWIPGLQQHAGDRGLQLIASAFDSASVRVLEATEAPAHKIASSETTNLAFLHEVASTGKPLIISTAMCDMVDVEEAVNVCIGAGNRQIVLLQCGAMYPLPTELANVRVLTTFIELFGCPVGLSDHTLGHGAAAAAVGLGATVFEKHFTLDRAAEGPDHAYALEPSDLKAYVSILNEACAALGSRDKKMLPKERELGRREGLYAARDLDAGEVLTAGDIQIRRPAVGLRARYATAVIGARVTRQLSKDNALSWDALAFGPTE